jgi:hypothetical protein
MDAVNLERKGVPCALRQLPVYARSKQTSGMPPLKRARNLSAGVFVIRDLHRGTKLLETLGGGQPLGLFHSDAI